MLAQQYTFLFWTSLNSYWHSVTAQQDVSVTLYNRKSCTWRKSVHKTYRRLQPCNFSIPEMERLRSMNTCFHRLTANTAQCTKLNCTHSIQSLLLPNTGIGKCKETPYCAKFDVCEESHLLGCEAVRSVGGPACPDSDTTQRMTRHPTAGDN
jgi:hypothetical protein